MVFRPSVAARWAPSVAPIELFRPKQKQFCSDSLPVSHDCATTLGGEVRLVWSVRHQSERIPLAKLACHTRQSVQAALIRILSSEYVIAAKFGLFGLRCVARTSVSYLDDKTLLCGVCKGKDLTARVKSRNEWSGPECFTLR